MCVCINKYIYIYTHIHIDIYIYIYIYIDLNNFWPWHRYSSASSGCGTMNLEPQSRRCCGPQAEPSPNSGWDP